MVSEGDALAALACGKPAGFPVIDAKMMRALLWLCSEHKNEHRYVIDPVVGEEPKP